MIGYGCVSGRSWGAAAATTKTTTTTTTTGTTTSERSLSLEQRPCVALNSSTASHSKISDVITLVQRRDTGRCIVLRFDGSWWFFLVFGCVLWSVGGGWAGFWFSNGRCGLVERVVVADRKVVEWLMRMMVFVCFSEKIFFLFVYWRTDNAQNIQISVWSCLWNRKKNVLIKNS